MTGNQEQSKWIEFPRANPKASMRLFCFPYAGGSSLIYRNWQEHLPASVEVCAIQLPGRGNRLRERPQTRLSTVVEIIGQSLFQYLNKPFAFFGHSMGALIAFEVARYLRRHYGQEPSHLFASARSAPKFVYPERALHALPADEFMAELRRLNGTPQQILDSLELMNLLIPTLRADFELGETHVYTPEPPLACPLSTFGGLYDDISRERLEAWSEETSDAFSLQMFPGDHFFLHSAEWLLMRTLSQRLNQLVKMHT